MKRSSNARRSWEAVGWVRNAAVSAGTRTLHAAFGQACKRNKQRGRMQQSASTAQDTLSDRLGGKLSSRLAEFRCSRETIATHTLSDRPGAERKATGAFLPSQEQQETMHSAPCQIGRRPSGRRSTR